MAAISTVVAVAGLALGAAGAIGQYASSRQQQRAQERMARLQEQQNELAQRRAMLEAARKRRALIRQTQIARADALSAGANQGALGSSGVEGGMASVAGQGAFNVSGVNQGVQFGQALYSLGTQMSAANAAAASAASRAASFGGLSSLGGALVTNSQTIGQIVGSTFGVGGSNAALDAYTGPTNSFS